MEVIEGLVHKRASVCPENMALFAHVSLQLLFLLLYRWLKLKRSTFSIVTA